MESWTLQPSDRNRLVLAASPLWKAYDLVLLIVSVLCLDFQAKIQMGPETLLSSKLPFLLRALQESWGHGRWAASLPIALPLALAVYSLLDLGHLPRVIFEHTSKRALFLTHWTFFPLAKREKAFEDLKEILLTATGRKVSAYVLAITDKAGEKMTIAKSTDPGKLKLLAQKIKDTTHLPLRQIS